MSRAFISFKKLKSSILSSIFKVFRRWQMREVKNNILECIFNKLQTWLLNLLFSFYKNSFHKRQLLRSFQDESLNCNCSSFSWKLSKEWLERQRERYNTLTAFCIYSKFLFNRCIKTRWQFNSLIPFSHRLDARKEV